jgi:hypothetical protein
MKPLLIVVKKNPQSEAVMSLMTKIIQFKIDKNGFFSIKIPVTYPLMVSVNNPLGAERIFLEPGKTLFHFINSNLFMGVSARVNDDLSGINKLFSFNPAEMKGKILDLLPSEYKLQCENSLQHSVNKLKEICGEHRICTKAYQLCSANLNYRFRTELLSYKWDYQSAYYSKNSSGSTAEIIPDSSYYSFLNAELLNNPLAGNVQSVDLCQ